MEEICAERRNDATLFGQQKKATDALNSRDKDSSNLDSQKQKSAAGNKKKDKALPDWKTFGKKQAKSAGKNSGTEKKENDQ